MVLDDFSSIEKISSLVRKILLDKNKISHIPLFCEFQSILSFAINREIKNEILMEDPGEIIFMDGPPSTSEFLFMEEEIKGINSPLDEIINQSAPKMKGSSPASIELPLEKNPSGIKGLIDWSEVVNEGETPIKRSDQIELSNYKPEKTTPISIPWHEKAIDTNLSNFNEILNRQHSELKREAYPIIKGFMANLVHDENLYIEKFKYQNPDAIGKPTLISESHNFIERSGGSFNSLKGIENSLIEDIHVDSFTEKKFEQSAFPIQKGEEIIKGERALLFKSQINEEENIKLIDQNRFPKEGNSENSSEEKEPCSDFIFSRVASRPHLFNEKEDHLLLPKEMNRPVLEERAILNQFTDGLRLAMKRGEEKMHIRLHPPSLGELRMEISTKGNLVQTMIFADNEMVKAILENNTVQLRLAFEEQGLKMDQFQVFVNGKDHDGRPFSGFPYNHCSDNEFKRSEFNPHIEQDSRFHEMDKLYFLSLYNNRLIYIIV